MERGSPACLLLIYVDETDKWGDPPAPLYEAIVEMLFGMGMQGATVNEGIMGYGANGRMHRKRLFGVTDDRPVTISVIDEESRLRAALPAVKEMVKEGVVFLLAGERIA